MSTGKLFMTGATGYIGGSALSAITQKFPALEVTALLRSPSIEFKNRYPRVKIVVGTFDDFNIIKKAALGAEIIMHTGDIDHIGCVNAILSGVSERNEPSFLIHLTGTGCISDELRQTWDSRSNPRIWHDVNDIKDLYDLPDDAPHHLIDKKIMDAPNGLLKTACICSADVYGQGTGIGHRTTFLVPTYVKSVLKKKECFYLGAGENIKAVIHITDLVNLFLILLWEALRGGGGAQWGRDGFYFAIAGEVRWKDAAEAINSIGITQKWLPADSKPVSWTVEQLGNIIPHRPRVARYLWGSSTRAYSARAHQLGWKPQGPSFWEALPEDVSISIRNVKSRASTCRI
ncbi:hypothetical protein V8E51_015508 [Hyaloscypha variabilis]